MPYSMMPDNGRVNRVERLLINMDTQMPSMCANMLDCDKRARTPYQIRVHEHVGRCNSEIAQYGRHAHYTFCSERCLLYFAWATGWRANELAARNNGKILGMLPPGSRTRRG